MGRRSNRTAATRGRADADSGYSRMPRVIRWRRSSQSTGADGTCVEVACDGATIVVRDSKDPTGPVLRFSAAEWRAFVLGVRRGEFDLG
jgi:Domain of unknown function (DUF397)